MSNVLLKIKMSLCQPKIDETDLENFLATLHKVGRKYNTTVIEAGWFETILYSSENYRKFLDEKTRLILLRFTYDYRGKITDSRIEILGKYLRVENLNAVLEILKQNHCSNTKYIPININTSLPDGNNSHANLLLYNIENNNVYYFEPHGCKFGRGQNDQNATFNILCALKNLLSPHGKNVIAPFEIVPYLQGLQSFDSSNHKVNEMEGYCALWCYLIEFILVYSNINTSIENIIDKCRIMYMLNENTDKTVITKTVQGFWTYLNSEVNKTLVTQLNRYHLDCVTVLFNEFSSDYSRDNYNQTLDVCNFTKPVKSVISIENLNANGCNNINFEIFYHEYTTNMNINVKKINYKKIHQTFQYPNTKICDYDDFSRRNSVEKFPDSMNDLLMNISKISIKRGVFIHYGRPMRWTQFNDFNNLLFTQMIDAIVSGDVSILHYVYENNTPSYTINNMNVIIEICVVMDDIQEILYEFNKRIGCAYILKHRFLF
jgi:hypothetical protein